MNNIITAANALLHQIEIGDFFDSQGHSAKMLKPVHDLTKALAALTPSPAPSATPQEAQRTQAIRMAADALSHAYVRAQEVEDRVMYRSAGLLLDMLFATPQAAEPASAAPHQGADALREALEAARKHIDFMRSTETSVRAIELQSEALATIDAALAHQAPQQGEPK